MRRRIVILKTGSTFPDVAEERGDYEDWVADGLGVDASQIRAVDARSQVAQNALPAAEEVGALVVTGSAAMVTDREQWSVAAGSFIRDVVEAGAPVLAICYGHQLLAEVLGGEVGDNPHGRQMGTVEVLLSEAGQQDGLLGPAGPRPRFQVTHRQSVLRLPPEAVHLGSSPLDDNHAFRIGDRVWAVQFHPEFDARAMATYIDRRREMIAGEGGDPDDAMQRIEDTPEGPLLLARFATLIG